MHKKNAFCLLVYLLIMLGLLSILAGKALAVEDIIPPSSESVIKTQNPDNSSNTGLTFFDEATVKGGFYSIYRNRVRYKPDTGRYGQNLDHLSVQAGVEFNSGYVDDFIGIDVGLYASADLRQRASVDHEMNFFPWSTPYKPNWGKTSTDDGFSFYKAHFKLKTDNAYAKLGYFQPTGPGVLGVNWSFFPGTYRGAEIGYKLGLFEFAVAMVDEYKAPWFFEPYGFRQYDVDTHIPWLGSAGARYNSPSGFKAELAYGTSKDFLHNAHLKLDKEMQLPEGSLNFGYHLYAMADSSGQLENKNNIFDGSAWQHYLYSRYSVGLWTLRLEGTATVVKQENPNQLGYFAYRLTVPSGSSKGAYDVWWDARSDWNADNEKAVFLGAGRKLDDVMFFNGLTAGMGYAFGFDGRAYGASEHLKESAWIAEISYTHERKDALEGAWVKVHYTHYNNHTNYPSWSPYRNAFQDERDVKVMLGIPFGP